MQLMNVGLLPDPAAVGAEEFEKAWEITTAKKPAELSGGMRKRVGVARGNAPEGTDRRRERPSVSRPDHVRGARRIHRDSVRLVKEGSAQATALGTAQEPIVFTSGKPAGSRQRGADAGHQRDEQVARHVAADRVVDPVADVAAALRERVLGAAVAISIFLFRHPGLDPGSSRRGGRTRVAPDWAENARSVHPPAPAPARRAPLPVRAWRPAPRRTRAVCAASEGWSGARTARAWARRIGRRSRGRRWDAGRGRIDGLTPGPACSTLRRRHHGHWRRIP